jgi:hypothetical protein
MFAVVAASLPESWNININLEQHACQDQMARVSRATVAEVMAGAVGNDTKPSLPSHHPKFCLI